MFNNASHINASHSTFSEVHRDQYVSSTAHVQGHQTVNTIVHGNQVFQATFGLESLLRASVPGAAFDSIDRHPAPACLPGTRVELLARIVEWIDSPVCDQRICWLSGLAGSGKSAIAQSIAEKYASQRRLAASFFFSRKEILRRKAQGFFSTIACQTLAFAPSVRSALLGALDADATIPTKVLSEQARRLLQEPISSSMDSFPCPVLMVVDSLDECDNMKMTNEIVRLLAGILCCCRWPLKVLFTSRAEAHIIQTFQHSELHDMTYFLQIQDFSVDNDIRAYLRHSFACMRGSMNDTPVNDHLLPWPSDDEIEIIVQKAAGLFIFATTVIKYVVIDRTSPVARLQAVLQAIQDSSNTESSLVHSPLDMLYLDALRRIPDAEKVSLVLGSIVFAFRPLSTHGLNDLLSEFQFDASNIVKDLGSVLVVSDLDIETKGIVRVYHTSFRDFLTIPHRSHQYFVDPTIFHPILARACLQLMNRYLTNDICGLGDPSLLNCEIKDLGERCKHRIKEGVRYACRWFTHHLSQVSWDRKMDNILVMNLYNFANKHLLNWIEVLSLTGELDSVVLGLREVADWLKRSPEPYEEVLSLFRDAERFLLFCYDSIQQTALQVYYSLPCVPSRVQIRTTYTNELERGFVITRGLDDQWKLCIRSVSTGATVKSLAISPSGRLIASAGDTPGVQLWDMVTGNNIGHLRTNETSACPVVFSPSGDYVSVGYNTGMIDIWDVTTGQRLLDPSHGSHFASVTVLAFSLNGFFAASGAVDASVHLWDISTRRLKLSFTHQKGPITCLLFSSDDALIATSSDDASVITTDVHTGRLVRRFRGHASKVNSISFSPDSLWIVSGSDDQTIRLWDTRTAVCLRTFSGAHKKPIRQVWITADSKYVVSVCNMDIYMWDTSSPSRKYSQRIWSVNHYFKKMATMFPAWYAKVAKLFPAAVVGRLSEADDGTILYAAPSPDGKAMGCTYGSSILFLESSVRQRSWSKVLGRPSALDEPPLFVDDSDGFSTVIAMTLDAAALVTSADDGTIKIWNTSPRNDWKMIRSIWKTAANDCWPAPDGRSILVKPMVGVELVDPFGVVIKDLETGGDFLGDMGAVPSPDSRYFAYWAEYVWNLDNSFSIHIYDASTGARLKRIPGLFNITCCRFSAESDFFACTHGDGVAQVWELPSVLCKSTIMTGHATITTLEFLPGNLMVVVGSDQGWVEVRLVETGDVVHRVQCSPSKVLALAVPNEALVVAIGHEDGSIFVWDPSYTNVAPHRLSPTDWVLEEAPSSDDAASDPKDGVDFVKFTGDYRSVCTRSQKGVICTWNLTRCLADYAEREQESSAEGAVDEIVGADVSVQPSNLSTDRPTSFATLDAFGEQSGTTTDSLVSSEETRHTVTSRSCPHLVSRSDPHVVYDRYLRSTYSVDCREGWVYRGSRRMFWLPGDFRPAAPTALSAFEDRLVIVTNSRPIMFFDLRPMIGSITDSTVE